MLAALCVLASVTYPIYDPDLWQHLRVGRAIWESRAIPHTQLWSWPTYGAPDLLPSWLYRALLYPFWALGGVHGLFAWRWLTALAVAALGYATARRMGARGLAPLVALVWCALLLRMRSQARPETLVAVLMAAQLFVLESRRSAQARGAAGGGARWLPAFAWGWANMHLSWPLGLLITGVYAADEALRARAGYAAAAPRALLLALVASFAAGFLNPFGAAGLWQPFDFWLHQRHEVLFTTIGELKPIDWSLHVRDALPAWIALVAVLMVWRWRRGHGDRVAAAPVAAGLVLAPGSQRFLGFLAVMAAPFFARDLAEWAATWRLPRALSRAPARVAAVGGLLAAAMVPSLMQTPMNLGYGFRWQQYPVRACDTIERLGLRGRMFGSFSQAGYVLWRFWPDRGRLPFMDIHQSGTEADRYMYAYAWSDAQAWADLDGKYHFDLLLLPTVQAPREDLLSRIEADSATWRPVFADEAASLFVRRELGSPASPVRRESSP